MGSRRCGRCRINYPLGNRECVLCTGRLAQSEFDPDPGWEEIVDRRRDRAGNLSPDELAWRLGQLRALGFQDEDVDRLAYDGAVRLGDVRGLIRRGCPHETAVRILG